MRNLVRRFLVLSGLFGMFIFTPGIIVAGNLDPSNPPGPTMHTLDEIYAKLNSGAEIVSAYLYCSAGPGPFNIMTVPNNKIFILTDCFGWSGGGFVIEERLGGSPEHKVCFYSPGGTTPIINYHLMSGIPFAPNSEIWVGMGSTDSITISGYLIDAN